MAVVKAEKAKRKVNPLVAEGHLVFVSYDSAAFETRTVETKGGWNYNRSRMPNKEFDTWLLNTAGPRDVLWHAEKAKNGEGVNIYFFRASHAMMCKLAWGGR